MPNVTLEQIGKLTAVAEKLEKLEPPIAKKFPGTKKLLEKVYDTDPSRTSLTEFANLTKKVAKYVKDVEKLRKIMPKDTIVDPRTHKQSNIDE